MKLHRDLGVTQKTAWHLAHRIRETWAKANHAPFAGPVEVDETFIGGKREALEGRGAVGKVAVAGAKDRATKRVSTATVPAADTPTLQGFVRANAEAGATIYTDDAAAYRGMAGFDHEAVKHSVGEYVRGMAHTNGMESFWAMLKRGYHGTHHWWSRKHTDRYVGEFAGRHNRRDADTVDQMADITRGMVGRWLLYRDLVA